MSQLFHFQIGLDAFGQRFELELNRNLNLVPVNRRLNVLFADKDREDIVYAANKEVNIKVCIKVTGCIVRQRESRNWTLWTFCAHKCTQQCTQQCTRYSSEQEGGRAAEMQTGSFNINTGFVAPRKY